ncbi:MAG: alpha-amylase [Dysgonamonadaceae bacterium]|jgi:glycosidase|nr:alpha-amylase [Dysgonamonadaceae bacterium]
MGVKIIIYQVLPRLFGNRNPQPVPNGSIGENGCGKLSSFTLPVLKNIRKMGCTHIWYTGLIEHATQTGYSVYGLPENPPEMVKGKAGSPYAIRDYYQIDPDLADDVPDRMAELEALVQRTHNAGLKVVMDFVPNHVSPANRNFEAQNYFYSPGSDRRVSDYDWTDTVKLNYENRDTWQKMRDILLFWASKNIDGFRCDMAEMVPVGFWEWAIPQIRAQYPGVIFIAEVYNPQQYREYIHRGKFDYLYDKVGLYEVLRNVITGRAPAEAITGCWQAVDDIQPRMLNFLENHDEQRIASDFFAGHPVAARPALVVAALMNVNPFMVYAGQELGERGMDAEGFSGRDGRTTIFDYWSIPVFRTEPSDEQKALRQYYTKILRLCNESKAIREGRFYDLMYVNRQPERLNPSKQYAFLRYKDGELLLVVANFDDRPVDVRIWIPAHAFGYFGITDKQIGGAKNFLSRRKCAMDLPCDALYPLSIPAFDAAVIRFNHL